ncbi:hypothetical protein BVRB_021640, partial [Beta vulgaris subsp. vulgaris]
MLAFAALILVLVSFAQAQSQRHTAIAITVSGDGQRETTLPAYLASWGPDLASPVHGSLSYVVPSDACSNIESKHTKGSVLVIDQGQCTFADKMHNLKALSPTAVIVVGQPSIKSWFVMGPSNITDPLPAVMVLNEDGQTLKNYNSAVLRFIERHCFSLI